MMPAAKPLVRLASEVESNQIRKKTKISKDDQPKNEKKMKNMNRTKNTSMNYRPSKMRNSFIPLQDIPRQQLKGERKLIDFQQLEQFEDNQLGLSFVEEIQKRVPLYTAIATEKRLQKVNNYALNVLLKERNPQKIRALEFVRQQKLLLEKQKYEMINRLEQEKMRGISYKESCKRFGIPDRTFRRWRIQMAKEG